MPTALVILPTGTYRAEDYLAASRRLGVDVITGSERPQALAAQMGDHFLELDLAHPDVAAAAIVAHASRLPIDAVIAVDDEGLFTAALASEALGLRHSPTEAVRRTRDKAAMRAAFLRADVPQPRYQLVEGSRPEAVAAAASLIGYPVVMKPCSLSGSRGVIRVDSEEDAVAAAVRIGAILADAGEPADAPLLVEQFVPGPEVALEGVLVRGELEVVTIFDKPDPLDGPFFEETLYLAPTRLVAPLRAAVVDAALAAIRAIGLTDGPVHAELRVPGTPGAPVAVLEVAARTIGGRCSRALDLGHGATLEDLVIARALDISGPSATLEHPAGVLMIPIPGSGTLMSIAGFDDVRTISGITGIEQTVPIGRRIRALPEGDRYLGFVFASAGERDDVERALRAALARLDVTIVPDTDSGTAAGAGTVGG